MSKIKYTQEDLQFAAELLNTPSPTSLEQAGQKKWLKFIKQFVDEIHIDAYGSAYGVIKGTGYSDKKVMIEAHVDEIGYMVKHIDSDGLIYVARNGGSDVQVAPSKRVVIHTEDGEEIPGVFGWPAIHTRAGEDPEIKVESLFIDIGAESKEEVEKMGIEVGNVITYQDQATILNEKWLCGRALDNRIGGFMIATVAREIKRLKSEGVKIPYDIYVVNSVQEEIGLHGAEMIAKKINPDVAIITDVTHHTETPMLDPKKQGSIKSGSGPVISYGSSNQRKLVKHIKTTAQNCEIPFQQQAAPAYTGTDTDAIAYTTGAPSALISLPLKYMHTTNEMVKISDIEHTANLILESLLAFDPFKSLDYFELKEI